MRQTSGAELMTPAEWESCLTLHYLRSDGPLGGTPLAFLDATPAELAWASREDGLTEDGAQRAFLSQFDRSTVQAWLDGQCAPPALDGEVPGYFRFLVLTALVSATEEGVGATHNFRIRLGELLGGRPLHSVSAVNRLWKALVGWCDRRREVGQPIRRVILPTTGSMTLIGHAVRIAFPSWRDRRAFTRVLRAVPREARQVPERLVQELSRPHRRIWLPAGVLGALEDFEREFRRNHRMLLGHRFWTLVQSIDARLCEEQDESGSARWTLEGRFSGYEQDVLELRLFKGVGPSQSVAPVFQGGLHGLEEIAAAELPSGLARAMTQGVLFLSEGLAALWTADESGPRDHAAALLVARSGSIAFTWSLDTTWTSLEGGWSVSGRLDPLSLIGLRHALGLRRSGLAGLVDLSLEGGVKTARSTWLGRPRVLPLVTASSSSRVAVRPIAGAEDILTASGGPPKWALHAPAPLTGRWLLTASEGTTEIEKVLTLEADAPERWDWSAEDDQNFEAEEELVYREGRPTVPLPLGTQAGDEQRGSLDDILEVIYAGAGSGWAESDLVAILEPLLPSAHFVWDFLRGLAEGSWLEPCISKSWRARKWRLCAPSVCVLGPGNALIEGSVATVARRRLVGSVDALGGHLLMRPGVSPWAPPLLTVCELEVQELAKMMAWRCLSPVMPAFATAPLCWPDERRTSDARLLAGIWSFELGRFVRPETERKRNEGDVELHRLVRERGDDRDLYRVTHGSEQCVTSSRTVAILEAYRRRKTPLFNWSASRFYRTARGGHLPLPVAKALPRRSLCGSGPVIKPAGGPSYEYVADVSSARWLAEAFGPALAGVPVARNSDLLKRMVRVKRGGSRPSWYTAPEWVGQ
jgi:hypothetical protein